MNAAAEDQLDEAETAALLAWADDLIDAVLRNARDQLASAEDERDEIEVNLNVKINPVDRSAEFGALKDCIEICIQPFGIGACYHRECKGKRCGDG